MKLKLHRILAGKTARFGENENQRLVHHIPRVIQDTPKRRPPGLGQVHDEPASGLEGLWP